jgi:hypothetical protein
MSLRLTSRRSRGRDGDLRSSQATRLLVRQAATHSARRQCIVFSLACTDRFS